MAFDQLHADALAEAETLRQELAEARADRVWEANRANEAARLSAEARDQADDLRREIEKLNEHVTIVEGDRTDNDRWAVNLVVEFYLDPNHAIDPYQAIARGLREWRRHVLDSEAKLEAMARIRNEAKAAEAELAEAHQRIANLSAQCNRNTEQIGRLQREAAVTEAERDAWREVVETAKAVRELWRYDAMGAAEPEIHAFVAAVDALPTKDGA